MICYKSIQLSETIKKSNLPKLETFTREGKIISCAIKTANKELGQTQRNIDIARSRGFIMEDILCNDHTRESPVPNLRDDPQKSDLIIQIEKDLPPNDYNYERPSNLTTATIVDFMF